MAQVSPFTRAVVTSMQRLYPEVLADKSFDNTGLLLEAPYQSQLPRKSNSVLLTIDLTQAVADEAIRGNHSVVVAYHPIIFRGLKSLTLNDTQQASLLRLAASGISVYSPHTAVDIVPDGMGDWLCDVVTGKTGQSTPQTPDFDQTSKQLTTQQAPSSVHYSDPYHITVTNSPPLSSNVIPHTRSVVTPSPESSLSSANKSHTASSSAGAAAETATATAPYYTKENTGAGRVIEFSAPQSLTDLVDRIATSLNKPKAIQIALPQQLSSTKDIKISTVGLCPGSGSSVLRAANPQPDLILTGEMSHHETLSVIERGGVVITLNHSNSERGYLSTVMRHKLEREISTEWERIRIKSRPSSFPSYTNTQSSKGEISVANSGVGVDNDDDQKMSSQGLKEMLADDSVNVVISQVDRDPFGVMILQH